MHIFTIIKSVKRTVMTCFGVCLFFSCEDFVTVDPPRNEITQDQVFAFDESAEAAVNGIYSSFGSRFTSLFSGESEVYTGVLSDELSSFSTLDDFIQFSTNEIDPIEPRLFVVFWQVPYQNIFAANAAIEALRDNNALTPELRNQLLGETLFLRAYLHFYLVNFFGDVPYINTANVNVSTTASREPMAQVYDKIIADLTEAKSLLAEDFSFFQNDERTRPTKVVATALLARVFLYTGDWEKALSEVSEVIESGDLILEPDPYDVFLATSRETIWQIVPTGPSGLVNPTGQGSVFVLNNRPPGVVPSNSLPQVALNNDLLNTIEAGDLRASDWIATAFDIYKYSNKYQNNFIEEEARGMEYSVLFRLAEMYLIRAEANAQLGNLASAITDLDMIRGRAQLSLVQDTNPGISQSDLLEAIYRERKIELLAEGHRWFDLKRTGRADQVLGPIKPNWDPTDVLLPIPEEEIFTNVNLTQNPGY